VPIEPRFRRSGGKTGGREPLPRLFVDREAHVDAVEAALERRDRSQPKVLVYYGIGGIGKSRLRRELRERPTKAEPEAVYAEVDFSLPSLRGPETALFALRRQLVERHHVGFPSFDIVYAHSWTQSRPNVTPAQEGSPLVRSR